MKRSFIFLGLVLCFSQNSWAQMFWFSGVDESAPSQMELYSGPTEVTITSVSLPSRISVLVHLASLSTVEWDLVQTRIRSLVAATRQAGGVDVYIVSDSGLLSWPRSTNAGVLQADLRKLEPPATPISAESAWSEIAEAFPEAPETFASLIVFASPGEIENAPLNAYASAYLAYQARAKRFRIFHWPTVDGPGSSLWTPVTAFTCGRELPFDFAAAKLSVLWESPCSVASYTSPRLSLGVFPHIGRFSSASVPLLAIGNGWLPTRIDRYMQMLRAFAAAESAFASNDTTESTSSLAEALQVNPLYPPALRLGISLYRRQQNWETAHSLLLSLSEVTAGDPEVWADLGEMRFNLRRWESSESAYRRSLELNPQQPQALERLSVIRENQNDLDGAEQLINSVLSFTPARVELHVKRGDLLERLNRSQDAAKAFEEALRLNADLDDIRIRLVDIYTVLGAAADAQRHLRDRVSTIPADLNLRMKYGELASAAKSPEDALTYFNLALAVDPAHEAAYFGQANSLVALNRQVDALAAVGVGLKATGSIRLHLMKFDLLEAAGRLYDSRATIEDALAVAYDDADVLKRYSRIMDVFGNRAGEAYERLAVTLRATNAPEMERRAALKRGVQVALRDGETAAAQRMAELLPDGIRQSSTTVKASAEGATVVPGGAQALALVIGVRPDLPAATFGIEYSQALLRNSQGVNKQASQNRVGSLHLYFETLGKLREKMSFSSTGLDAVLETTGQSFNKSEDILKLLGWRIRREKNRVALEVGVESDEAERQIFSAGFGVDFLALKQALEGGQAFSLHIPYDSIPIAFDETFWFSKVMDSRKPEGGLFEALVEHIPAARLYVAVASIKLETRLELLKTVDAERLATRYSDLLAFYGSSLSVADDGIEVPGGRVAAAAWGKLVGANPGRAGAFLKALLENDDGKLLAYFHTLSNLPIQNQQFFTRTSQRLIAFYKAFPFSEKNSLERHAFLRNNTHFFDLLRELPLNTDGDIEFPGSEQVWILAKGTSGTSEQIGKLLKQTRKTVAPDLEDEILLNMLERNYQVDDIEHNQTENFLAIVRLEKHRPEPMDEATALTLSQNYGRYNALYPYFSTLPPLNSDELTRFFRAVRAIDQTDGDQRELALAEFHGIISLLTILSEVVDLADRDVISTLLAFCDAFSVAKEPRGFAAAALDALQHIVSGLPGLSSDAADARLINALSGPLIEKTFRSGQQLWRVNRSEWHKQRISRVLALQTATPIQVLLNAYRDVQALRAGKADRQQLVRALEENSGKLLEVLSRPEDRLTEKERDHLIKGRPREIAKIISELKKESAKRQSKSIPKLANDYLDELIPYLKVTLTAWTYAQFASPDDLIIAEDQYFVRRHVFYPRDQERWAETYVRPLTGRSGMYLTGGLAQIATAAGQWGLGNAESSESIRSDGAFDYAARTQLAAIRTVPWPKLDTETLHLAALQLRVGRELLVNAAGNDSLRRAITDRLIGWVGTFRRLSIDRALMENDSRTAIELLSSTDLYFLVDAMKTELPNLNLESPLLAEFRKYKDSPGWSQVGYLGGFHLHTYGCVHPHLVALGPYEEFERIVRSDSMSERLSHLLLNAAEAADREGIPSDALAIMAEPLLRQVAANVKMTDTDDWLAAIDAMNSIDLSVLLPELDKAAQK